MRWMQKERTALYVHAVFPDKAIVSSKDVEDFWHRPMLGSPQYPAERDAIFGRYLHHFRSPQARGREDKETLNHRDHGTQKTYVELLSSSQFLAHLSHCGFAPLTSGTDPRSKASTNYIAQPV